MILGPSREDHRDAVIYRSAATAFRRGDLAAVFETIHDDVAWHFPGTSWLAREIHGQAALRAYLHDVVVRTGNTFILEDVRVSGTDHAVVALQQIGAKFSGQTQKFDVVSVMRFEGGRQVERWFYPLELVAFDAFFAKFDPTA